MNGPILEHVVNQLNNLFRNDIVLRLAKESRLIQRSNSKLNPLAFLMMMIIELSNMGTLNLGGMCDFIVVHGGCRITAQALSLRLNKISTVKFLKLAFSNILETKLTKINFQLKEEGILGRFKNTYIEDSTSCELHEKVAGHLKGSGGGASKAGYKIHTIWNATKSCIERLCITPSSKSDQSQAFNIISLLKKGDLVLRDLGYFTIPCFREIHELGAYFVSRLKSKVNVYTLDGELIEDLSRYVDKKIFGSNMVEIDVRLGLKEKLQVRLVAYRVPQSTYDQRVRKLRRKGQKNSSTPTKEALGFNRYTFFVTNIPKEKLETHEIATLYKLRWQIELLFKSFKSNLRVDMIKGQSKNRVECFIIAKLIAIMLTAVMYSYVNFEVAALHKRELSFTKFANWILNHKYFKMIFEPEMLDYDVIKMKNMDILSICKQKRSRRTSKELLEWEVGYENLYSELTDFQPLKVLA